MRAHVIENNKITNTIEVDNLDVFPGMYLIDAEVGGSIGDSYIDGVIYPAVAVQVIARMTVLAFRNRFTAAEKAGIELGAVHNPSATAEAQMKAASIRAYLADVQSANHIEPTRPETRGGVQVLEYWGFIAVGRSVEILDNPIQVHEAA